ncbi:MAG: CapA family protein [Candidatus Buchananbacteria bacterium]
MKKYIFIIILSLAIVVGGVLIVFNFAGGQRQWSNNQNETMDQFAVSTTLDATKPIILPKYSKPEPAVSLLAVGDIMLSRSVEAVMVKKNDFTWPFKLLANDLRAADITFGNLETPIIAGRPILPGEFSFRTDPKSIQGLQLAGFDVLSLANNHTLNFGQAGFASTFSELNKAGIKYVGAGASAPEIGQPIIIEKNGLKFGFLAYTYGQASPKFMLSSAKIANVNYADEDKMKNDITALRPQVDFVIVSLHEGTEYQAKPNKNQKDFAQAAIEAGASLVLGHHPHVVQTFEKYQDGYIIYSLGNFVFDQTWSEDTQEGLMLKIVFQSKKIKSIEFLPIKINKSFQPNLADATTAKKIINRLQYPISQSGKYVWNGKNYVSRPSWKINSTKPESNFTVYQSADLDGDNQAEEAVVVNRVGYVIKNNQAIWRTDAKWQVDNVLIGDFNNDGQVEIGFSLWKEGSYGPSKPFWVKENDKNISNHLFLYQWDKSAGNLKNIWGSSALDNAIWQMNLGDFDQDGQNELAVLEIGAYGNTPIPNTPMQHSFSIWRFSDFNFFNVFKSATDQYGDLEVF